MLCYEYKTQSIDYFKAENEFESTFISVTEGGGGTITTKRNNIFNSGSIKRLNKAKESQLVCRYLHYQDYLDFVKILVVFLEGLHIKFY